MTAESVSASTVRFESVTKRYSGAESVAVEDLSFEVPAGEICVLVGPSGCGKTTALRMVNRTVEMTSGDILIGGNSVKEGDPARLRREIGYVIQQIGLFPHRTISQNIGTVPNLLGWDKERVAKRSAELLELIGLDPEYGDRYPTQLSGGQQQRVGVARALAVDPPVMLMDEPFGAIDPINRSRLQNEFLRLQAELRKTVLFVTHDVDEAIKMGDKVAVLKKGGQLAQFATPTELLMEPADDFVEDFVGSDRALKRLALMRVRDVNLWTAPLAQAGDPAEPVRTAVAAAEVPHALLVDGENRPQGWLSERDLAGERVPSTPDSLTEPLIEADSILRDGLAALLQSGSLYAAVVDHRGRLTGVLSVEIVSDFLASDKAAESELTAVERPHG
ncbi:MAG: osmoprotectant transport system ATP-binding protein [Actinomycetota bacterium]|nr:osmoprotectant transport system ATP-binding protein [Actinomycetota bacterium]